MNIAKNLSLLRVVWQHFITLTSACDFLALEHFYSIYFNQWTLHWIYTSIEQFYSIFEPQNCRKTTGKNTENSTTTEKPPRRAKFLPIGGPTFELSSTKLGQSTTKTPPELCNRTPWDTVHKMRGRLNHSKGPKSLIYYTPLQPNRGSSSTDNLEPKAWKIH